ncbi:MAG: dTDP-4-dehydrorhamnose reductase [Burkholderiales bacterium]|nr:dTDP-4-dehydrorhamnose reductase [Burkholderiales bacterium]
MKILLTGVSGQLGHALQKQLAGAHTLITPTRAQMDLSQPWQIEDTIRSVRPDLIINPAAYTAVDLAESEPELALQINAVAPAVMAAEAKALGIGLIHYSTDYVFDGGKADADGNWLAYTEQDRTAPLNVYGETKLAGEQAIRASGCAHLIFRTSWVYSLHGKNFLLTMLKLASERDQLRVVDDQWGVPNSADWLASVSVEILAQAGAASSSPRWWQEFSGLYHLSASGRTNWCEFARSIMRNAEKLGLLQTAAPQITGIASSEYPTAARRPQNSLLNSACLQQRFNVLLPDWEQNLRRCLQKMQTQRPLQDVVN